MLLSLIQGLGPDIHAILAILLGVWAGTLGAPIPEEVPLLSAGVFAAMGVLPLHWAIAIGMLACFSGDVVVFAAGRRVGRSLHSHPYLRRLMRGRYLLRARHMYLRQGRFSMFVARLLPGVKMPFLFTAGAFRMPWGQFLARDLACVAVLAPTIVFIGFSSSLSLAQLSSLIHRIGVLGALVAAAVAVGLWVASSLARRRRRAWRARCVAAGIRFPAWMRGASLPSSWF